MFVAVLCQRVEPTAEVYGRLLHTIELQIGSAATTKCDNQFDRNILANRASVSTVGRNLVVFQKWRKTHEEHAKSPQ